MSEFFALTTFEGEQAVVLRSTIKGTAPRYREESWFLHTEYSYYIISKEEAQRINAILLAPDDTDLPSDVVKAWEECKEARKDPDQEMVADADDNLVICLGKYIPKDDQAL